MAWALLANQKHEEAEALARQALRFDSRHAGAYVNLGSVYKARGRWPDAEKMLRQALTLKPDEAVAHEELVFVLEYQGKHAEAAAAAEEAVRLDPMNPNNHHQLAWIHSRRGDLELAEQGYREELKLRPERAWSHQDLGCVLHRRGKLDEAKKQFEEARTLDPFYRGPAAVGNVYASVGFLSNATQQYAQAVAETPDDHHAAMRLAFLLLLTGDREGYEKVAQQMLERSSQSDQANAARRTLHVCLISPQIIGSIDQHQRLMEIAAGHDEQDLVQRERGLTAYRAGDWEGALAACRESRQLSSQSVPTTSDELDPQNLLIEALALHQLGQAEESRAAYYEAARKSAARYFAYAPDYLGAKWVDWVAYEIVRREAAELLSIYGEGNGRLARQRGRSGQAGD
jgi:tetratricopeptide (TPR) repeat protein